MMITVQVLGRGVTAKVMARNRIYLNGWWIRMITKGQTGLYILPFPKVQRQFHSHVNVLQSKTNPWFREILRNPKRRISSISFFHFIRHLEVPFESSYYTMFRLTRLQQFLNPVRCYSTASDVGKVMASTIPPVVVDYLKDKDSRKTYLINRYKHILSEASIVLFLHHNNLLKNEINTYRHQIREYGGDLTVVRNNLMKAYLRAEHEAEPASVQAHEKTKSVTHPLSPLLSGPTAIVTIKENNPKIVNKIIKFTKSTNEKLFLVGARIEGDVFDVAAVNRFKDLPSLEELHAQLAGMLTVLSGAGLVQTLQSASQHLYLTLESHRKNNDPSEAKPEEK